MGKFGHRKRQTPSIIWYDILNCLCVTYECDRWRDITVYFAVANALLCCVGKSYSWWDSMDVQCRKSAVVLCCCRKSRSPMDDTTATHTSRVLSTRRTFDGYSTTAATSFNACTCASTSFYETSILDGVSTSTLCTGLSVSRGTGGRAAWPCVTARLGNSCTRTRDYGQMHAARLSIHI